MKWYTCCNEAGLRLTGECLLAAARSCLARTSLTPHLVYEGRSNALVDHLGGIGVRIIPHRLSFGDAIRRATERAGFDKDWALGTYLRFDLPLLEQDDDVLLYTDTDVVFCKEPGLPQMSGAVGAANEYVVESGTITEASDLFNAGVLLMNVPALRRLHPVMVDYVTSDDMARGAGGWYDQGVLNALFRNHRAPLPQSLNWRPFARPPSEPEIIHFHRLKPADVRQGRAGALPPDQIELLRGAGRHYARAMAELEAQLNAEDRAVLAAFARC